MEEWNHECEVRMPAGLPLVKRNEVLDEPQKGMKFKRGEGAVADVYAEPDRYGVLKSKH